MSYKQLIKSVLDSDYFEKGAILAAIAVGCGPELWHKLMIEIGEDYLK